MSVQSHQRELILASTSTYRRDLLARLRVPFKVYAPDVDESPLPGEPASAMAQRLALAKARRVAGKFPESVVIGCDQVAESAGIAVGKPGTPEKAVSQLLGFSGKLAQFHTATSVVCIASAFEQCALDTTAVQFRELTEDEVRRYIALDKPMDCAGSFKTEAAGPMLMQSFSTQDPTAIIGLPLIALARLLRAAGFQLP
jgi:septum formation protein